MTQSREVLAMMDAHTTTFGRKRGCTISRCGGFLLGTLFLLSIVITALLVYHFAPCADSVSGTGNREAGMPGIKIGKGFGAAGFTGKKLDLRLPRSVVPVLYRLKLTPFIWPGNFTFNGEVEILVNVTEDTKNITLHATNLDIDEAATKVKIYLPDDGTIRKQTEDIGVEKQTNDTLRQFHVIHTSSLLKAGKQYTVNLKFVGYLNDYLEGFYRSSYAVGNQTRWIATTQFQPTDARQAFPCFDEPALKAQFEISIARPKNMTSISNMKGTVDRRPIPGLPTYEWDHYERSVPMSTYLVAFVVSDFATMRSKDGKVSVWARSEALDQSLYSLEIAPKILKYFEDYFQIEFPLPKMDMIALPDFSAGAMENWGLITYRETAMLYQESVSTSSNLQRVATVVSHELAHQWFGNLVTPSWWTDLWLNEGFASYVEYLGMNSVEPDWRVLEQFVVHEVQNVFGLDALESSHPISVEVGDPDEISEIFDRISYAKGASIIRMMDHFLTTDVFKRGLTNYLREKAYQSAEQNDLWDALTKQAHKDKVLDQRTTVKQIMDTWTLQTGFPVVTVIRDYERGGATLTQKRFLLQNSTTTSQSGNEPLWWVPITFTSQNELNFKNTKPSHWMEAEPSLTLHNLKARSNEWMIFNVQETGYYRVNYDEQNWRLIIQELSKSSFKNISTINRAQLVDDALNLARAGQIDYATALDVTSYLAHESEYLPWKAAYTAMGYLDSMLVKAEGYDRFRIFALKLLDNVYKLTGFIDTLGDPHLTVYSRIGVLSWACSLGHEDCVRNAVTQFHNWRTTPSPEKNNPISPNLKSVVYCTAIRVGGQIEWDFAWQQYQLANVGSEKDLLLHALGCSRETWILSRYLNWAVTENSGIRKQDASRIFGSVSNNVIGQPLAFNFLRNEWVRIKTYLGSSLSNLNSIITSSTKRLNAKYQLNDLLEFANDHSAELGTAKRAVQQAAEHAQANIKWLERNHGTILSWLKRATA